MVKPLDARSVLPVNDDDLVACVACGLCLPHCPTYRVTGLELASPRGRIAAMREVQGGAPVDATFERFMEECVQCRGCEAACPSSVPFGRLMEGARVALHERRRSARPWRRRGAEWLGYRVLLPHHRLLRAASWVLLVAQRLHLVPRAVSLPRLSAREMARRLDAHPDPDVVLFTGCVMDAWQRDIHRAAIRVMQRSGAHVGLPRPGGDCCGALHAHAGRLEEARRLARRVIRSVPVGVPIVVDSAGCGAMLKDYGHLLDTPDAHEFAARVYDFAEWVEPRAPAFRRTEQVVVVQDPCHLRHVQHAEAPTRRLLGRAYDTRLTADDGLCCGAGGAYNALQPDLARAVRDRKVAALCDAAPAGAPFVVSSANPGCAMHLGAAGLDVRHPAELLAERLEDS